MKEGFAIENGKMKFPLPDYLQRIQSCLLLTFHYSNLSRSPSKSFQPQGIRKYMVRSWNHVLAEDDTVKGELLIVLSAVFPAIW